MTRDEVKKIIEVLLFVSERPLPVDKISEVVEGFEKDGIKSIIEELNGEYAAAGRSFGINEVGGGFQILTDPFYAPWVRRLTAKDKSKRLSTPALETLAIVAYKQPVTRADIEAIRGVSIEGVLDTLLERNLIKTVGRKDVVGRPFMYGTTKDFLIHFGLNSLEDLPKLNEFTEADIQLGRDELIKKEDEYIDKEGRNADEERGEDVRELAPKD